ncbi:oxidoreductase [Tateyamaria omphalii]|uniref:hypothetical protein n=1 Tax=Tateyamaria omphalii TaxID=299262 RepID=UPI00167786E2|nr:hypothetical protein [Tateyamaria omphalii]GGX48973.1 oxidoreductase [Tateyamaria omphalii]
MAIIRTYSGIKSLEPTFAEIELIDACKNGEPCTLGNGKRPFVPSKYRLVRAEVLRYLVLGGSKNCKVAAWGVRLQGAYITGELNLSHTEANGLLKLKNCTFEQTILAQNFTCDALNLEGSSMVALKANGANIDGNLFLQRTQFNSPNETVHAALELENIKVTGSLDCSNATIHADSHWAINAQSALIRGDVNLYTANIHGGVALAGIQIDGQLQCTDTRFDAGPSSTALFGHRMVVHGSFIWRPTDCIGKVDLISARVGDLADDLSKWEDQAELHLDGFVYQRLVGTKTSKDVRQRRAWLAKGASFETTFFPQPYTQLASVLASTGNDYEARNILATRERLLRRDYRRRLRARMEGKPLRELFMYLWTPVHFVFADLPQMAIVGYGHHPFRSLVALITLILLTWVPASKTWSEGSFAPNSAVIQISPTWINLLHHENPAEVWSSDSAPGQDWETFGAFAYAIDVVIPIIDFGQTDAWAPSTTRNDWGRFMYWWRWVMTGAGWIVTALGAAAITGIIRRE